MKSELNTADLVSQFVKALQDDCKAKNLPNPYAYTTGYLESFVVRLLEQLPASARRAEVAAIRWHLDQREQKQQVEI